MPNPLTLGIATIGEDREIMDLVFTIPKYQKP